MTILRHIQFCGDMVIAGFHLTRETYYRVALDFCGDDHPDAWLLARRMVQSRLKVNDFLARYVT